jgi:hypothetical protein
MAMRCGHSALALAAALALVVPAAADTVAAVGGDGAAGREVPAVGSPGPTAALLSAAAYPGLGQLVVGSELKAAAVGATQAFLIGRLVLEDRWTRHALRLYHETGRSSYYDDYSEHYDRRLTLVWWALAVGILSVADAYVDAHLIGFDDPVGPGLGDLETEAPPAGEPGLRVGLAVRF